MVSPRLVDATRPVPGRPVEYVPLRIGSLMRQGQSPGSGWYWAVNPYRGCEYGCAFCEVRLKAKDHCAWLDFERRIGVKANAVEVLLREVRALEIGSRPIVFGTSAEPWQQAEEQVRLTRSILEALAKMDGLDLRVSTRSSLIARDCDLLQEIARGGHVLIAVALASIDERVNRLLEPRAPSALRRFSAMEALARAGLDVGLLVSPVLPGLDDEELGLEALLTRAANAGARFAGLEPLRLPPGQREAFFSHVDLRYPDLSTRFRRVVGRRTPSAEELARTARAFESMCLGLGLRPFAEATLRKAPEESPPVQLSLFS